MSIFEAAVRTPPFLAGVAAISLTKEDLSPTHNDATITILLYTVQITNSLFGLIISGLGIILRTRMDLEVARFQIKLLQISPFLLAPLMMANCVLTHFYMKKALAPSDSSPSSIALSYAILSLLTLFGLVG